MPHHFRPNQRPDGEVVVVLETILKAAKQGNLQSVVIIGINLLHDTEVVVAGRLTPSRITCLIGALARASRQLLDRLAEDG